MRRCPRSFVGALVGLLGVSDNLHSQCVDLVPKEQLTGAAGDDFGDAMAFGLNSLVVGASSDAVGGKKTGTATVYRRVGGVWTFHETLAPFDGDGGDLYGDELVLQGDLLMVGARRHAGTGAVFVYRWDGSNFLFEQKLTPSDGGNQDNFGFAIDLEGEVAVVGADDNDEQGDRAGAAYVFRHNGSTWAEEAKLVAEVTPPNALPKEATGFRFGRSVAIEGATLLVGAFQADDNFGRAYVYEYDGAHWVETHELLPNAQGDPVEFGRSVALENGVAFVGAQHQRLPGVGINAGAVYVYEFDGTLWNEVQFLQPPELIRRDNFGHELDVLDDQLVVRTAPLNHTPYTYLFQRVEGTWTRIRRMFDPSVTTVALSKDQLAVADQSGAGLVQIYELESCTSCGRQIAVERQKFESTSSLGNIRFAEAVVAEGNHLAFSRAASYAEDPSKVFLYQQVGSEWQLQQTLTDPALPTYNIFGTDLDIDGNQLAIGAAEKVHVYAYDGSQWVFEEELQRNVITSDEFGQRVAIHGDRIVVGAPPDSQQTTTFERGAFHIFERSQGSWSEMHLFEAPLGLTQTNDFGEAVAIENDLVVVSAPDTLTPSVYIYQHQGGTWPLIQTLTASDVVDQRTRYGQSLELEAGRLIIGSWSDDEVAPSSGAAYVYEWDGNQFVNEVKLLPPAGSTGAHCGWGVDIQGDAVIVGCPDARYGSFSTHREGLAYTYYHDGLAWHRGDTLRGTDAFVEGRTDSSFGSGVAVSSRGVFVGAPAYDFGRAYAYRIAPKLDVQPNLLRSGDTVRITACGGGPGRLVMLALVEAEGTPTFVPLVVGTFDAQGEYFVESGLTVDPVELGFQAIGFSVLGELEFSNTDPLFVFDEL